MAAYVALSGMIMVMNSHAAAESDSFIAAGQIVSAQRDLSSLKPDVFNAIATLQRSTVDAQVQSEKFASFGNLEGDLKMKSIDLAFRDGFASHAQNLAGIQQLLVDLGHIGEQLETNLKLSTALLADFEQMSGGHGQISSSVNSVKEGLHLLQNDLVISGIKLENLKHSLVGQVSAVSKFDGGAKQLLANSGSPQDKIKKWQDEVIKTAIEQNKSEAAQLSTVSSLAARMAQVLLALSEAVKAEQRAVDALQE